MFKKGLIICLCLLSLVVFISCKKKNENKQLKLGVMTFPFVEALNKYVKPALEKEGIDLQIIEFSDYNTPNLALNDGTIDVNAFQHKPFLDKFNYTNNTEIVPVPDGISVLSPLSFYSKKINGIEELQEGDKIALPNDPTNEGRALFILQNQADLIKLKDGVDINTATPNDIIENPLNLVFVELDAAQIGRVIDDFALVTLNGNYAIAIGLDPLKDNLLRESEENNPYINIFATKKGNENDPRIQKLIKAFQTKEVAEQILLETKGGIVPVFKY